MPAVESTPNGPVWVRATLDPIDPATLQQWAATPECGAVASFLGVVRDHSADRAGVTAITYEAYEGAMGTALAAVADRVLQEVPEVQRLGIWHRTGRIGLGECSLIVVVGTPHRAEGFAACEFAVETVKASLPIWKYEHSSEGGGWSSSGQPLVDLEYERS